MKTNCHFFKECLKSKNCNKILEYKNYIELMVILPDCYKDKILIEVNIKNKEDKK